MTTMKGDASETNRTIFTGSGHSDVVLLQLVCHDDARARRAYSGRHLRQRSRHLVATGKTIAATVSEYSTLNTFAPPVDTPDCLAPYAISIIDCSDPRSLDRSHGR